MKPKTPKSKTNRFRWRTLESLPKTATPDNIKDIRALRILPCPFCNHRPKARVKETQTLDLFFHAQVYCDDVECRLTVKSFGGSRKPLTAIKNAIEAWNKREGKDHGEKDDATPTKGPDHSDQDAVFQTIVATANRALTDITLVFLAQPLSEETREIGKQIIRDSGKIERKIWHPEEVKKIETDPNLP